MHSDPISDEWFTQADFLKQVDSGFLPTDGEWRLVYRERRSYVEDMIFYMLPIPKGKLATALCPPYDGSFSLNLPKVKFVDRHSKRGKHFLSLKARRILKLNFGVNAYFDDCGKPLVRQVIRQTRKYFYEEIWVLKNILYRFLEASSQIPVIWFVSDRYSERSLNEFGLKSGTESFQCWRIMTDQISEDLQIHFPRMNSRRTILGRTYVII